MIMKMIATIEINRSYGLPILFKEPNKKYTIGADCYDTHKCAICVMSEHDNGKIRLVYIQSFSRREIFDIELNRIEQFYNTVAIKEY